MLSAALLCYTTDGAGCCFIAGPFTGYPAMASAVDTVTGLGASFGLREVLMLMKEPSFASLLVKQSRQCTTVTAGSWVRMVNAGIRPFTR